MADRPLVTVWGHFLETYTLLAILRYKCAHDGNSPTVRELAEMQNFRNRQVIHNHIKRLVAHELVTWRDGKLCVTPRAYALYASETPYAVAYPSNMDRVTDRV